MSARQLVISEIEKETTVKRIVPEDIKIGAMLETPSLAFSSDEFYQLADFISIGGNDLKQFFFAADRENELVRKRYDTLNLSYLNFLERIIKKAELYRTPLNFCGEDAGRPVECIALIAIGLTNLSMRASAIGRIKALIRSISLEEAKSIIDEARITGENNVRERIVNWLAKIQAPYY